MQKHADHPAVLFGEWLRQKRKESGTVARVFAQRIELSFAEYVEVESGVVKWIEDLQEVRIPLMLDLSDLDQAAFSHKLFLAKEASKLEFSDIFSEEQLTPLRCCSNDGNPITSEQTKAIIKAVFAPLVKTKV